MPVAQRDVAIASAEPIVYRRRMRDGLPSLAELRHLVVEIAYRGQEGHIPSALSILDLIWVVYTGGFLDKEAGGKFVLSKGHGCLALYAVLGSLGYFPRSWFDGFADRRSRLGGHPDARLVPGVEASTGSLGHGFPIAAGLAYAKKIGKKPGQVFVLVGDGEANEGTIWETALVAAQQQLTNLTLIVDNNESSTRAIDMGSIAEKFRAFNWAVTEINGHDADEISSALGEVFDRPHAIIARTIKGFGITEMENNPAWHHRAVTEAEFEAFTSRKS